MDMRTSPKSARAAAARRAKLAYQSGFGNTFSTEAEKGALPVGQNSPQKTPRGLYPEVLSGTAFTAPRAENLSSWLYKLRPTAMHAPYRRLPQGLVRSGPFDEAEASPNRLRWNPLPIPQKPTTSSTASSPSPARAIRPRRRASRCTSIGRTAR
jgi:homogentisate 1,2-dioxygenase